MNHVQPTVLVILDGFGYRKEKKGNAIAHAHKPCLDKLFSCYPHTILAAADEAVGLMPGYIGNSEVGHLTIGAGRIIPQAITLIHEMIDTGVFFHNHKLHNALKSIAPDKKLHIMGLLSDAGVHSHEKHLYAYIDAAVRQGIQSIVVHPFLDGRDVAPRSAAVYLERLEKKLSESNGIIGSLHGRFYAMDRDNHWDRTYESYRILTEPQKIIFSQWHELLTHYYAQGVSDEFIPPIQLTHNGIVADGDGIIFFNVRPDRARQLTRAFIDPAFNQFPTKKLSLACFVTPIDYGHDIKTTYLIEQPWIKNSLKEVLSKAGKKIFTIAETEKYAHVTYFFSGGREEPWSHEERVLIPSLPLKNYVEYPCMSASAISDAVIHSLRENPADFYLINYANADMVGHAGNFDATIKAIECLDKEVARLYDIVIKKLNGTLYITADHGNAEEKIDPKTGQPLTAHTTNPVPFIMIRQGLEDKVQKLPLRTLANIASFILKKMHLNVPAVMQG